MQLSCIAGGILTFSEEGSPMQAKTATAGSWPHLPSRLPTSRCHLSKIHEAECAMHVHKDMAKQLSGPHNPNLNVG